MAEETAATTTSAPAGTPDGAAFNPTAFAGAPTSAQVENATTGTETQAETPASTETPETNDFNPFADWTRDEPGGDGKADTEPETVPDAEKPDTEKEVEKEKVEVKTDEKNAGGELPTVEFAPEDTWEDFSAKRDEYLSKVELPAEVQAIIDRQNAELETRTNVVSEVNTFGSETELKNALDAVSSLNEYRKDDTSGLHVPDTSKLLSFVKAAVPQAYNQLATDILTAPSEKYAHLGYNRFHEMLIEQGVAPTAIADFTAYIDAKGQMADAVSVVPSGVPPQLAEAYKVSPSIRRDAEAALEILSEKDNEGEFFYDASERNEAQAKLDGVLAELARVQRGINAEKSEAEQTQALAAQARQNFETAVWNEVQTAQIGELNNFGKDLSEKLTMIGDDNARTMQVIAYKQLVANAFADDFVGAEARKELAVAGVKIDYTRAQQLFSQQHDIAAKRQTIIAQTGDKSAAARAVEKEMTNVLRELSIIRRGLVGQVASKVAKSYGAAAQKEADSITKPKVRAMPKNNGSRELDSGTGADQPFMPSVFSDIAFGRANP